MDPYKRYKNDEIFKLHKAIQRNAVYTVFSNVVIVFKHLKYLRILEDLDLQQKIFCKTQQ